MQLGFDFKMRPLDLDAICAQRKPQCGEQCRFVPLGMQTHNQPMALRQRAVLGEWACNTGCGPFPGRNWGCITIVFGALNLIGGKTAASLLAVTARFPSLAADDRACQEKQGSKKGRKRDKGTKNRTGRETGKAGKGEKPEKQRSRRNVAVGELHFDIF